MDETKVKKVKVFLGWSGSRSREFAEALAEWLPMVLHSIELFLSTQSIPSGSRWNGELSAQIQSAQYGILCVTDENINAPWLCYEAGALAFSNANAQEPTPVTPVLFGVETQKMANSPLKQFQHIDIRPSGDGAREAMLRLTKELDSFCGRHIGIQVGNDKTLEKLFQNCYPDIEGKIMRILNAVPEEPRIESPPDSEENAVDPHLKRTQDERKNQNELPEAPHSERDFMEALDALQNFDFYVDIAHICAEGKKFFSNFRSDGDDPRQDDKPMKVSDYEALLEDVTQKYKNRTEPDLVSRLETLKERFLLREKGGANSETMP